MGQRIRPWTIAMATAALVGLPVLAGAQSSSPGWQSSSQEQENEQQQPQQNSPEYHLNQAKQAIDSIDTSSLNANASTAVSRLKIHFRDLYQDYQRRQSATGTSGTSTQAHADWRQEFAQTESDLDNLRIPRSQYAPTLGGTTGTSGTLPPGTSATNEPKTNPNMGTTGGSSHVTSGSWQAISLPDQTRNTLEQFRTQLEQFYSLTGQQGNEKYEGREQQGNEPDTRHPGSTMATGTSGSGGWTGAGTGTTGTAGTAGTGSVSGTTGATAGSYGHPAEQGYGEHAEGRQSQDTAKYQLEQAKRSIKAIDVDDLKGQAKNEVKMITKEFDRLYKDFQDQSRSTVGTTGRADMQENNDLRQIQQRLDRLNIRSTVQGVPSEGTSGMSGVPANNLPASVTRDLQRFRMHLDKFEALNGSGVR